MSQVSSLSNVHLISCREDVISLFKKSFVSLQRFYVQNNLSSIWENGTKIIVLDGAMLENTPPNILSKLAHESMHLLLLEPFGISDQIKDFIETNFTYVIPFPIEKKALENYFKKISYVLNHNNEEISKSKRNILTLTDSLSLCGSFVGTSAAMKYVRTQFERVAQFDTPVLLMGETGTGKTTGANVIHKLSKRRNRKMEILSMSTVSDTLANSTFFGTETGAYTDAIAKKGVFKMADKSTLLLDEIGLTSPLVQKMLLNVLNSGEIQKVGSDIIEKVDVRIISATNEDLEKLVSAKEFRRDLYYRINDNIITLPPLRDRKEDLPTLVETYLIRKNRNLSSDAMEKIMECDWPGNIRQLYKCLESAFDFYDKDYITADELSITL